MSYTFTYVVFCINVSRKVPDIIILSLVEEDSAIREALRQKVKCGTSVRVHAILINKRMHNFTLQIQQYIERAEYLKEQLKLKRPSLCERQKPLRLLGNQS